MPVTAIARSPSRRWTWGSAAPRVEGKPRAGFAPDDRGKRRAGAPVRHVRDIDTGLEAEEFGGDVQIGPVAA